MNKCFLLLVFISCASCKKKAERIHPTKETITESVYASGVVKSNNQYQVFAAVNGILKQVFINEGELVKKGQPLMQLSDVTARLNIENARIAAEYNSLAANADKLSQAKLDIDLAKAKLDNDASLLERQRSLWQQGIGSKNDLDQRELALKNSTTAYSQSKVRYEDLQKQLDFAARQSQKQEQVVSSGAADFTVKSEVNGKVYRVLKKVGEIVTVQTPLAILGDSLGFTLEMQVDEYDITRIKPGQQIVVSMDSYKGQAFDAVVNKINPIMNEQSKSFTVEAVFTKPPPALFPNLTLEANIVIAEKQQALVIPRSFLLDSNYVILANKEKRKVVTGLKDYQKAEIISGISAEDELVKPE
jgi:multidrug resistance efflux pump